MKIIEELDVNTPIDWWNDNRSKLNAVIRLFDAYQLVQNQNMQAVLLAKIISVREWGKSHNFSEWQYNLLNDMEQCVLEDAK
jgi:hypothetical protein